MFKKTPKLQAIMLIFFAGMLIHGSGPSDDQLVKGDRKKAMDGLVEAEVHKLSKEELKNVVKVAKGEAAIDEDSIKKMVEAALKKDKTPADATKSVTLKPEEIVFIWVGKTQQNISGAAPADRAAWDKFCKNGDDLKGDGKPVLLEKLVTIDKATYKIEGVRAFMIHGTEAPTNLSALVPAGKHGKMVYAINPDFSKAEAEKADVKEADLLKLFKEGDGFKKVADKYFDTDILKTPTNALGSLDKIIASKLFWTGVKDQTGARGTANDEKIIASDGDGAYVGKADETTSVKIVANAKNPQATNASVLCVGTFKK